jgi:hypothetical protein
MARKELRTFRHIVDAIIALLKLQSTDSVSRDRIKSDVQRFYMQEVIPYHNWPWLRSKINVQAQPYFGTGTATVTNGSVTVTLTEAPTLSRQGHLFSVNGSLEIYRIRAHTANSTTVILDTPYVGTTSSTAGYKIWTDAIPLPPEALEIIEITHPFLSQPLDGMGLQELRRLTAANPKAEGRPRAYTMTGWVDPDPYSSVSGLPASATRASTGTLKTIKFATSLGASAETCLLKVGDRIRITGASNYDYNIDAVVANVSTTTNAYDTITYTGTVARTESSTADTSIVVTKQNTESYEKQNQILVHPAIYDKQTQIAIDFIKDIAPLDDDNDEPSIPLNDRIVLFWGGLFYAYSRERNPEEALIYRNLADQRLAKMAGRTSESIDKPILGPSKSYIDSKRNTLRSRFNRDGAFGNVGNAGSTTPQGTANRVAVFGNDGFLASSLTIDTTELGYLDGINSNIQAQLDAITTLADGKIYIGNSANTATEVTPSGDVTIDNTGVTAISPGVIVDADINASAAITRSKTATGTAYRLLANDSSGVMSENAALTPGQMVYADSNGQLASTAAVSPVSTSVSLADNQASAADVLTWATASYDSIVLQYSIKRGSANKEVGTIHLSTDGTNASIAVSGTNLGTLGVTFSADVSGSDLRLRYTSTSTGTAPTFKYFETKWLA